HGDALLGPRPPERERRRIVAALIGGPSVLERPRCRAAREHHGEDNAGRGAPERRAPEKTGAESGKRHRRTRDQFDGRDCIRRLRSPLLLWERAFRRDLAGEAWQIAWREGYGVSTRLPRERVHVLPLTTSAWRPCALPQGESGEPVVPLRRDSSLRRAFARSH